MNRHGRIVCCGAVSQYDTDGPPVGSRLVPGILVVSRLRMEGFIVLDYFPRAAEAIAAISRWMKEGRFKDRVDVQEGLENAPATLARLFKGENRGKQLLRIADAS